MEYQKEEFLDETGSAWDEYHKEVCAISEIHDQSSSNFRLIHSINEPVYHTQQYSKIAQSIFGAINNHSPKLVVNALVKMMCCNFAFSGFKKGWFMRELEDGYDRAALKLQPKSGASFED